MGKSDQLGVCNDQGVPLEDFQLQFCDRCLFEECSRSKHGTSKFEHRIGTWHDRLFDNVPQLSPDDPRFEGIQAKRFREFNPRGPYEVRSSWADPRDLTESSEPEPAPEPAEVPDAEALGRAASQHIRQNLEAERVSRLSEPVQQVDAEPVEPPSEVPVQAPAQRFDNTPPRPGQMIGGKKVDKQGASPVLDPWEPQKTSTDDVEVVQPGARIRMGGSGV